MADENLTTLRRICLSAPLEELARLYEFTTAMPGLKSAIERVLSDDQTVVELATIAASSHPGGLINFMRVVPAAQNVARRIDIREWSRSVGPLVLPQHLVQLSRELGRADRMDLAEAAAVELLKAERPGDWRAPDVVLGHLSNTLRLAHKLEPERVKLFLRKVVTPEWLRDQYRSASDGAIAATLYSVWAYHGPEVAERFTIDELSHRLDTALSAVGGPRLVSLAGSIQLIGSCSLIGLHSRLSPISWPGVRDLHGVLRENRPNSVIGHIEVQLWLGLRELARVSELEIVVLSALGQEVLDAWKSAEGTTHRHRALNDAMIAWLENCAKASWSLLPDNPLDQSLIAEQAIAR